MWCFRIIGMLILLKKRFSPGFLKDNKMYMCGCGVTTCLSFSIIIEELHTLNNNKNWDELRKFNKNHYNKTQTCLQPHAKSLQRYEEDTKVTTNHYLLSCILAKSCIHNLNVLYSKLHLEGLICLNPKMGLKSFVNSQLSQHIRKRRSPYETGPTPTWYLPQTMSPPMSFRVPLIPSTIHLTHMT